MPACTLNNDDACQRQKILINFSPRYLSPILLKTTTNLPSAHLVNEVNVNFLNLTQVCFRMDLNAAYMLVFAVFSTRIVNNTVCYEVLNRNVVQGSIYWINLCANQSRSVVKCMSNFLCCILFQSV